MSDIFICYSRADSVIAKQLTERLEAEGWSVYLDVQTRVGSRWHEVIQAKLQEAKAVVALWSTKSRNSDFVLEEAEFGRRHHILFPVFIEPVEFPYGFSRIQTGDMIGWKGEADHPGLVRLLEALREHLGVKSTPSPKLNAEDTRQQVGRNKPLGGVSGETAGQMPETVAERPYSGLQLFIPGQTLRDPLKDGGEGPLMVVIPPGRFMMGSPPDEPERLDRECPHHEVIIQKSLALGVCAVTFADYELFCRYTKRKLPADRGWGRETRPVINVSWRDAQAYCTWLSQQTGYGYRLPSESEWEYACRAGTQTPLSFGDNITPEQVNYDGNHPYAGGNKGLYRKQTVPVQSLPPNAWGLYEMHGNVWEWVQDVWHKDYQGAPTDGSAWESADTVAARVLRGGSWYYSARGCRSAYRSNARPGLQSNDTGFRCARVLVVS
jgi:formylglycine-generating enzyme required for sulfatase activity